MFNDFFSTNEMKLFLILIMLCLFTIPVQGGCFEFKMEYSDSCDFLAGYTTGKTCGNSANKPSTITESYTKTITDSNGQSQMVYCTKWWSFKEIEDKGKTMCHISDDETAAGECKDISFYTSQKSPECCTTMGKGVIHSAPLAEGSDLKVKFNANCDGGLDYMTFEGICGGGRPCSSDDDCDYLHYCMGDYCSPKSCNKGDDASCSPGFCDTSLAAASNPNKGICHRFVSCSSDSECKGTQERCLNGLCLKDVDKDTYCESNIPKKYCGGQIDCHDTSSLCQETCVKTDSYLLHPELIQKGNRNIVGYDCDDFCIDYDGDYACAPESAKKIDDEMVAILTSSGFKEETFTNLGVEKLSEKIEDEYYKLDFKDVISNFNKNWKPGQKTFYDCDDKNEAITPFIDENNSCNFIDDDCDGKVDECSRPVMLVGTLVGLSGLVGGSEPPKVEIKNPSPGSLGASGIGEIASNSVLEDMVKEEEVRAPVYKYECVYIKDFVGCREWDYDQDGYMNSSFGCPDCYDCNDNDKKINPGVADCDAGVNCDLIDNNCNGLVDDMVDVDSDGIIDVVAGTEMYSKKPFLFFTDICIGESITNPLNPSGCWYSVGTARGAFGLPLIPIDNIPNWSTE